jgi:hypothetical protein
MGKVKSLGVHTLENGLHLEVVDESRNMASDRWRIRLVMRTPIEVAAHYHSPASEGEPDPEVLKRTIGPEVVFESIRERLFVEDHFKGEVIGELTATFLQDVAPYIGIVDFPRKYILKCYRERSG